MGKSSKLSVIIIAKNEEGVIEDCLESVLQLADEVIVIDTGSTDRTIEIAEKFKAKIHRYPSDGKIDYSAWRNFGLSKASGEWVLYIDADERVTPLLRKEIEKIIEPRTSNLEPLSAFAIPRKNIRLGKEMHFGGWRPDYVMRLIKRDKLIKWEGELHEQPKIDGKVGRLKEAFLHYSHRGSFEHKLQNTINWSKIEAQKLYDAGHPPMTVARFLSAMWREFYKRMIKYQAWRDGTEGIIETIYQIFSVFITYARLWELQEKRD